MNAHKRGIRLPENISAYWKAGRIWDRWEVEVYETENKETHILQRQMTIEEIHGSGKQKLRVLDLCCGTGKVTNDLCHLPNVRTVTAVDISEKALSVLTKRVKVPIDNGKLKLVQMDVMADDLSRLGKYDYVVCLDALHHLWDFDLALSKIACLLDTDGRLIGNFLISENATSHLKAKKGKWQYFTNWLTTKLFLLIGFVKPLWRLAGEKGYVRLAWLRKDQFMKTFSRHFKLIKSNDEVYYWFVAEQNRR